MDNSENIMDNTVTFCYNIIEVIERDERKHFLKPEQEVRNYFLRMVLLYSNKICELSESSNEDKISGSLSYLKGTEKELLLFLIKNYKREFTPIEVSREIGVTNKMVINRLSMLHYAMVKQSNVKMAHKKYIG